MNTEPIIHPVACLRCGDSGIVQRHPFIEPCDCPAGAERAKPQATPEQTIADLRAQLARMQAERDEEEQLRDKLGDILSRTAVALRGPEPELTRWSWHDLPELVNTLTAERDAACAYAGRLREALTEQLQAQKDFDNAAAEREGIDNHGMQPVNREYKEAAMKRFRAAVERLSAAEEESAAALTPPDALAAQQAETARLRDAIQKALPDWDDDLEQPDGRVCSEITYGDLRRFKAALA